MELAYEEQQEYGLSELVLRPRINKQGEFEFVEIEYNEMPDNKILVIENGISESSTTKETRKSAVFVCYALNSPLGSAQDLKQFIATMEAVEGTAIETVTAFLDRYKSRFANYRLIVVRQTVVDDTAFEQDSQTQYVKDAVAHEIKGMGGYSPVLVLWSGPLLLFKDFGPNALKENGPDKLSITISEQQMLKRLQLQRLVAENAGFRTLRESPFVHYKIFR